MSSVNQAQEGQHDIDNVKVEIQQATQDLSAAEQAGVGRKVFRRTQLSVLRQKELLLWQAKTPRLAWPAVVILCSPNKQH